MILGLAAIVATPAAANAKTAHGHARHASSHHSSGHHGARHAGRAYSLNEHGRFGRHGHYARYAGISCVPFARAESGIALKGNAATWWDEAEGVYARGDAPEEGSVLNFRANASMHLGHVAVVRDVVNSRQIDIDQANWWGPGGGHGRVSRDVAVIDVSAHNDWTAVRVSLGHGGTFGSVYPTYGFIYHRADGTDAAPRLQMASATGATIVLNPAPRDLRPRGARGPLATQSQFDEVAEAPADAPSGPLLLDAPNHNLR